MGDQERKAMEFEVVVKQAPEEVWRVHLKNFQLTLPAVVPGHFSKVEYLEGPPLAPGGVMKISYDEGFGHYDYVKLIWNEVDHEKYYCKLTEFEGGAIGKHFDGNLIYEYKVLPGPDDNSSIMSWRIEYKDIGEHDFHSVLKDELVKFSEYLESHIDTLKA